MAKKLPSFQFYPGDWAKEPNLRRCCKASKGVWIDMICLSFECEERGVFQTSGVPWSDDDIAAAVGGDHAENLRALAELLSKGVCSRNQAGAVFCRRVVSDENKRRLCSEAGKAGGGNPALTYKGVSKGTPKGGVKGRIKQELKASSSLSTSSSTSIDPPSEDGNTPKSPEGDSVEAEFLETWNKIPGCIHGQGSSLTDKRRKHFRARIAEPSWDWRAAVAKFPLKCLEPGGWRPDLDWFLRPDSVQKILEGKYDWKKNATEQRVGSGQRHEPGAVPAASHGEW